MLTDRAIHPNAPRGLSMCGSGHWYPAWLHPDVQGKVKGAEASVPRPAIAKLTQLTQLTKPVQAGALNGLCQLCQF